MAKRKTTKIRQSARGQECTLRLFPHCNQRAETVVLCHAPSESSGWAMKSPDHWAAYGCSDCHDIMDGRRHEEDVSELDKLKAWLRGVYLTQQALINEGLMKV